MMSCDWCMMSCDWQMMSCDWCRCLEAEPDVLDRCEEKVRRHLVVCIFKVSSQCTQHEVS